MLRAKLIGADELKKAVADYGGKVLRRAAKAGVTESAKEVSSMAKSLAPRRTNSLRRSIGWKVVAKKKGFGYVGVIGPRKDRKEKIAADAPADPPGKKKRKKAKFKRVVRYRGRDILVAPSKYAHLVEFGRRSVRVKKKKVLANGAYGTQAAAVPPHPFMRPAYEQLKGRCKGIIASKMRLALMGRKPT